MLLRVAACCSVLQCVAVYLIKIKASRFECGGDATTCRVFLARCCSMLQCVAALGSVLQHVAVYLIEIKESGFERGGDATTRGIFSKYQISIGRHAIGVHKVSHNSVDVAVCCSELQ